MLPINCMGTLTNASEIHFISNVPNHAHFQHGPVEIVFELVQNMCFLQSKQNNKKSYKMRISNFQFAIFRHCPIKCYFEFYKSS